MLLRGPQRAPTSSSAHPPAVTRLLHSRRQCRQRHSCWREPDRRGLAAGGRGQQARLLLHIACSAQDTEREAEPSAPPTALRGPGQRGSGSREQPAQALQQQPEGEVEGEGEETSWKLFSREEYSRPWQVPWGLPQVLFGLPLWGVLFYLEGTVFLPAFLRVFGPTGVSLGLPLTDKSTLILINQVFETAVTLGVLALLTQRFRPLPPDVFRLDFRRPFAKPDGWLTWACLAIIAAPPAVFAAAFAADLGGYAATQDHTPGTVDAVAQLLTIDDATFVRLFLTTAVLAPLLEELVFRGFLLTSLTKYMPTGVAVLGSAVVFGCSHLTSPRDIPQLVALGIVLGFAYVRSRNLLTPILLHGTWNGAVVSLLFALSKSGINVAELLESVR